MEYDTAAMRTVMKQLQDAMGALDDHHDNICNFLPKTKSPCDLDYTKEFHGNLMQCVEATKANHVNGRKQLQETMNALIAIDKEYNNMELANEMSLKHVDPSTVE